MSGGGAAQVLMATELRRTDSMVRPQMFQYDQHFDFEEVIGRSTMSEVGRPHHPLPPNPRAHAAVRGGSREVPRAACEDPPEQL